MKDHPVSVLQVPEENVVSVPLCNPGAYPISNHLPDVFVRHGEDFQGAVVLPENPVLPVVWVAMLVKEPGAVKRTFNSFRPVASRRPIAVVKRPCVRDKF